MSVSSLKREEILKWHRSKAATPEYTPNPYRKENA